MDLSIRKFIVLIFLPAVFSVSWSGTNNFKSNQLNFSRVGKAYQEKWTRINNSLTRNSIDPGKLELYLEVFKEEKEIEVWARNIGDSAFRLIEIFPICHLSGGPGPKRRQGDLQVPEGFYHIHIFNPRSNFYLSLGLDYPNASDRILGEKGNLGGDIFIHGRCVTIGCLPITDDKIKELYIYCVEARNNGQMNIPVTIYPVRLTAYNHQILKARYHTEIKLLELWSDLEQAYILFRNTGKIPAVTFLNNGRHKIE